MKFTILNNSSKGVSNMPGVEILNTTIHYKEVLPTWAIIVIIAIIAIPMLIAVIGQISGSEITKYAGISFLLVGMVSAAFIGIVSPKPTDKINYIEHEVLVDDSVSFIEFNKKYEIVKQKGKIYVIREKETNINGKVNK